MIKIRVGQFHGKKSLISGHFDARRVSRLSDARVHYVKPCGTAGWLNRSKFVEDYEFIPQNDLEWLAVNVNGIDVRAWYFRDSSSRDGYRVNNRSLNLNYSGKLVLNMHRYLSSGKKPHYEFFNGQWSETK
jgi:hypothetical protein